MKNTKKSLVKPTFIIKDLRIVMLNDVQQIELSQMDENQKTTEFSRLMHNFNSQLGYMLNRNK